MKLYFYRGADLNFGDELNHWLIPKVFPGFFDEDASTLFLAIGSILLDTHPAEATKIVFGSGYGGYTGVPTLDERWRVYAVRGHRTAAACGISPSLVAGDAAMLIRRFAPPPRPKRFKFSFMPHWESVARGSWQKASALAGLNFIDPRQSVDDVLDRLQETEILVTEAMHGAIVADALRIPWIPILPFVRTHRDKWNDWASALDVELHPVPLTVSSVWEGLSTQHHAGMLRQLDRWRPTRKAANFSLVRLAARSLRHATRTPPRLSSDAALETAVRRLEQAADRIKRDFPR
ncbi:MAG: polysaccharide pyruvyl transferase family protein [Burkholderiaceae bacterium]